MINAKGENVKIPPQVIEDAKKLRQWSIGNVCFADPYFAAYCRKQYGDEMFEAACNQVKYISMKL